MQKSIFCLLSIFLLSVIVVLTVNTAFSQERPNIVLIMVDDMGFSDLGCYGGEIQTPHLDRLAKEGLRFSQFYNCAKCETTRATLLSGRYHPQVNIRKMNDCATIAELLRQGGYTTLMTGKWHLTSTPTERGFDRYFGHLSGATNFFTGDNTFRLDGKPFQVPQQGFYTTDANTDYAIQFLNETISKETVSKEKGEKEKRKPFFLYIAYNAPHYPLQAPKEEVEKYRGKYLMGWDELRKRRYANIQKLGLLADDYPLTPQPDDVPAWETLSKEEKDIQDLMMATYAGMIDRVDQNIGRLVEKLQSMGEFENTLFMFLSDNGACPFQRTKKKTLEKKLPPWDPESYWTYDKGWAHACNTPFREYKQNQHEGGISTPFIVHLPKGVKPTGEVTHQVGHLVDIMATCLDVAGVAYPSSYGGKSIGALEGKSLQPIFAAKTRQQHDYLFHTFYGRDNALRVGDWKLVNKYGGPWELYNMKEDRTELNNLAQKEPKRLAEMKALWNKAAAEMGVAAKQQNNQKNKKVKKRK